ncbi:MAG: thiamine phosphate synthase [Elusimicrobiota bacterium]|jgi:thiamine-phosphate pyrophosphorylase|nr:thiamine phosphate synthase [Elusimicrobiota bacterium]
MKKQIKTGLYAITSSVFSGGRSVCEMAEQMLEGGIRTIQYREKSKPYEEQLKEAKELRSLTLAYDAVFIVNDNANLALEANADGLHIGQDDISAREVRRLIGGDMLLGLSTHSINQIEKAVKEDIDYIGVGPVFATPTKPDYVPVGLDLVKYAAANVKIPFVAIGGIKLDNLEEILKAGAKHICMLSEITAAPDIIDLIKRANKIIAENNPTLKVVINGKSAELPLKTTIVDYLKSKNINPAGVVVEINRSIVDKDKYGDIFFNSGDAVEIITFMAGG